MKKIFKFKKILIVAVLTFFASVVCVVFMFSIISLKSTKAKDAHIKYLEKVSMQDKISILKEEIESSSSDIEKLDSLFISEEETVDFLNYTEDLAKGFGLEVEISDVSFGESSKETHVLSLSINAVGTFDQVSDYLKAMENIPYEISIVSSSLSYKGGAEESDLWEANISFEVLSIKI